MLWICYVDKEIAHLPQLKHVFFKKGNLNILTIARILFFVKHQHVSRFSVQLLNMGGKIGIFLKIFKKVLVIKELLESLKQVQL